MLARNAPARPVQADVPVTATLPAEAAARAERRELVDRAVALLRPLVETIIADREASFDRALSVVVMDPHAKARAPCPDSILGSYALGNAGRCEVDYAGCARDKACRSFTGRMDTSEMRDRMTGLDVEDEPPLIGGVHRNGWTIGVSGAQPWIDEAIGNMLADLLRMLALQNVLTEGRESR